MLENYSHFMLYVIAILLHITSGFAYVFFKREAYHSLFTGQKLITSVLPFSFQILKISLIFPLQFLLMLLLEPFGLPVYLNEKNGYPNGFLPIMPFYKRGLRYRQTFSAEYLQKIELKSRKELLLETYPIMYWIIVFSGIFSWIGHFICMLVFFVVQIVELVGIFLISIYYYFIHDHSSK